MLLRIETCVERENHSGLDDIVGLRMQPGTGGRIERAKAGAVPRRMLNQVREAVRVDTSPGSLIQVAACYTRTERFQHRFASIEGGLEHPGLCRIHAPDVV